MRRTKTLLMPIALIAACTALVGCNKTKNDANTLNIVCLNSGYGREWIDEAVEIWKSENPGYSVNLNATPDARSIITSDLAKRNNVDDVYISVGTDWKSYAAQGKLLAIDDLLEQEVDGMKIKNKVNDEYKDSIYFKDQDGSTHSYRSPWISGLGGIFYNAKMFEENGWEVPTTTDELIALCQDMVDHPKYVDPTDPTSKRIYPFSYTGANTDYFDYIVYNWWAQISGVDAINQFKQYGKEDSGKFDARNNSTYAGLKQATAVWYEIFGNSDYSDPEDISRDNHQAQKNFMQGKTAMMINGSWCYNEILSYTTSHTLPSNFELKLMETPRINSTASHSAYVIGEDQYIAIPASTIKADLAKSFVKTLVSDRVLKVFYEKAHGLMAYKLSSGTYSGTDKFMASLTAYRDSLTATYTNFSSSKLFLNGYVDFWGSTSGRPFLGLLQGTIANVDAAFDQIRDDVARQWSTWVEKSKM